MLRHTRAKGENGEKSQREKTVKTGVCSEHSDASIRYEPHSSLMEYPGQRRAEGGRRKRRRRRRITGLRRRDGQRSPQEGTATRNEKNKKKQPMYDMLLPIISLTTSALLSLLAFFIWGFDLSRSLPLSLYSLLSAELCPQALFGTLANCETILRTQAKTRLSIPLISFSF